MGNAPKTARCCPPTSPTQFGTSSSRVSLAETSHSAAFNNNECLVLRCLDDCKLFIYSATCPYNGTFCNKCCTTHYVSSENSTHIISCCADQCISTMCATAWYEADTCCVWPCLR